MKKCYKCKELKPKNNFNNNKAKKDGLANECKICKKDQDKTYRNKNKEKIAKTKKLEQLNNPEKQAARNKKWKKLNKDKVNANTVRRRAVIKVSANSLLTDIYKKQIQAIYKQAKELEAKTGQKYHVDHIIPLRGKDVCGLHVPWNLQILTAEENFKKGNRYNKEAICQY